MDERFIFNLLGFIFAFQDNKFNRKTRRLEVAIKDLQNLVEKREKFPLTEQVKMLARAKNINQ